MNVKELLENDLDVIERPPETRERIKPKRPKSYMCVLHNDDYTDGEALVDLIMKHFKHDEQTAIQIVVSAHRDGSSPCGGPYSKDEAETRAHYAMKAATMHDSIGGGPAPLLISVEEA